MAINFTGGVLTITRAMTAAQATRYIGDILAANGISVADIDSDTTLTAAQKNQAKMDRFESWLWAHLKADAISWEKRQAAATQETTSATELP